MLDFVRLFTHHHLQSAQPPFLPLSSTTYFHQGLPPSSFFSATLDLPLIHAGLCCWAVMYLFAFSNPLMLPFIVPPGVLSRQEQGFCESFFFLQVKDLNH